MRALPDDFLFTSIHVDRNAIVTRYSDSNGGGLIMCSFDAAPSCMLMHATFVDMMCKFGLHCRVKIKFQNWRLALLLFVCMASSSEVPEKLL